MRIAQLLECSNTDHGITVSCCCKQWHPSPLFANDLNMRIKFYRDVTNAICGNEIGNFNMHLCCRVFQHCKFHFHTIQRQVDTIRYNTIELTNATMLKLGLTVLLDGSEVSVGCEPEWVKVANGGERARETEAKLALQ